jgi:hypothetical protein
MIIASGFLWARAQYLEHAILTDSVAVESALQLERRAQRLATESSAIQEAADNKTPAWAAIPIVAVLEKYGISLRNLHYDGKRFTIYAIAPSATDVMVFLNNSPLADEAEFTEPVRKRPNGEQFAVTFTPKPPTTQP